MTSSFCHLDDGMACRLRRRIVSSLDSRRMPPIVKMELFLTEACTLACDYCFVATKQSSRRMPWGVARRAIDLLLAQSRDHEEVEITFIGGEPLLEFGMMKQVAEYAERQAAARGKRVAYAVTTNGTRMTREMLLFARQRNLNYLLSIDGVREAHDRHRRTPRGGGSWDRVMGPPFDLIKSIQRWVGARVTVSPDTARLLSRGVRELFHSGVNQFIMGPDLDVEWTGQQIAAWSRQMCSVAHFYASEKAKGSPIRITEMDDTPEVVRRRFAGVWGCDAGRTRLAVSCAGDLYPCSRFVSPFPGMEGRFLLGSVFEGLANPAARIEITDASEGRRPVCSSCDVKDYCGGACPAVSLHRTGDIHAPVPMNCAAARLRASGYHLPRVST